MAKEMTNGEIIYTICMNHLKMHEDTEAALQLETAKSQHGYDFGKWSQEDRETMAGIALDISGHLSKLILFCVIDQKLARIEETLGKTGLGSMHDDKAKSAEEIEQLRRMFGDTKTGDC